MYINRPKHEEALRRAIKTGYNIVIFGDSGCGKSWLYKKVFSDDDIFFESIDFNSAETDDDVDLQMLEVLSEYEEWAEKEQTKEKSFDFKPQRMGVGAKGDVTFSKNEGSSFTRLLEAIRSKAGSKKAYLVFENLEYILDKPAVIRRVQSMLLALDDKRVGAYNVKICLVGVPSDIKEILASGNKFQTISNRVYEIPEVGKLERKSVDLLVRRGLEQELDYTIESKHFCCSQIAFTTYQTPQYLHDLCLHVALRAEDAFNTVSPYIIEVATQDWLMANARQNYEFVHKLIISDSSKRHSRSKIIYCISRLEKHFFKAEDVAKELEVQFPKTMSQGKMQVLRWLRKLASGDERLLKCDPEQKLFRVSTPMLRSSLRVCLKHEKSTERVDVKDLK